jgi:hypothetical protein
MKPETKSTTTCAHCGGLLEFAHSDAGKQTDCCYCGEAIILTSEQQAQVRASNKTNILKRIRPISLQSKSVKLLASIGALVTAIIFAWATVYECNSLMQHFDSSPSASWSTKGIILCCLSCVSSLTFLILSVVLCYEVLFVIISICICIGLFTVLYWLGFMWFAIITVVGGVAFLISLWERGGEIVKTIFICGIGIMVIIGFIVPDSNLPHNQVSPSWWDGSISPVKDWLKANANDPGSLKYVKWKSTSLVNGEVDVVVRYRAKNGFGALTLHQGHFVLSQDGTILSANPDMETP